MCAAWKKKNERNEIVCFYCTQSDILLCGIARFSRGNKNKLRTFQPQKWKKIKNSQSQTKFTGSYKKKECILAVQKQSLGLGQITIKSTQRKFVNKEELPKQALKQKPFHEHYCSDGHNGIKYWVITLKDSAGTSKEWRKNELYWMYKLKTYTPYGLNEMGVYEAF